MKEKNLGHASGANMKVLGFSVGGPHWIQSAWAPFGGLLCTWGSVIEGDIGQLSKQLEQIYLRFKKAQSEPEM